MTSPPEEITVKCPGCGKASETWYRPSVNLQMDKFSDEYLEEISTFKCPDCGHKVPLDILVVRPGGIWEVK